jgi:hypothetical protein
MNAEVKLPNDVWSARKGPEFKGSASDAMDLLAERKRTAEKVPARNLRVADDRGRLLLEVTGGNRVRQFPIRVSFLEKLLMWRDMPVKSVRAMPLDLTVSLLNHCLSTLPPDVVLRCEGEEALSIHSTKYTFYSDLETLKAASSYGVGTVSLCDRYLLVTGKEKMKAEPVAGDVSGISYAIRNSETGFASLNVQTYIYRYICSNGAVQRNDAYRWTENRHYGTSREKLEESVARGLYQWNEWSPRIPALLKQSRERRAGPVMTRHARGLDRVLGYPRGRMALSGFRAGQDKTLYDLYNHITDKAKQYDMTDRYRMEEYAGNMLLNAGRAHGPEKEDAEWPL